MRLSRVLRQHADPETGLSQSLLSALATVFRNATVTIGGLAKLERVQPPSMTRIVDKLEERGLVERVADADDARSLRIRMLPAGEDLLRATRARKTGYLAARLTELTSEEREALANALPALERLAEVIG